MSIASICETDFEGKRRWCGGVNESRLAFDMRLYDFGSDFERARERLMLDVASYTREQRVGERKIEERISFYSWEKKGDKVICPEFGEDDVIAYCKWDSKIAERESKSVCVLRKAVLERELPWIGIWMSPANKLLGYGESRAVIMYGDKENGFECFGLCLKEDEKDVLEIARGITGKKYGTENLRGEPLIWDLNGMRPIDFLLVYLPEWRDYWNSIKSGQAKEFYRQTLKMSSDVVNKMLASGFRTEDYLKIGAFMERELISNGVPVADFSGCGKSNLSVLKGGYDSSEVAVSLYGYNNLEQGVMVVGIGGVMLGRGGEQSDVCAQKIKYKGKWYVAKKAENGKVYYFWIFCEKCGAQIGGYRDGGSFHGCGRSFKP